MSRRIVIPGLLVIIAIIAAVSAYAASSKKQVVSNQNQTNCNPQSGPCSLLVASHPFRITIARTTTQQQRGLGGVTYLDPNQGMYFPLTGQPTPAFWMKGMLIPIDIIWIKGNRIAGIDANLPPPAPNTPDNQLTLYNAPVDQPDAVLETAANRMSGLHIHPGDTVKWGK